ncbi:hypothetical protein M514_05698, partial [Trichuris suis]
MSDRARSCQRHFYRAEAMLSAEIKTTATDYPQYNHGQCEPMPLSVHVYRTSTGILYARDFINGKFNAESSMRDDDMRHKIC